MLAILVPGCGLGLQYRLSLPIKVESHCTGASMNPQRPNQDSTPPLAGSTHAAAKLEEVIVRLRCYEPNSLELELTGEDLCRNLLLVGTVGSGKTTTLNPLLRQLIEYRASDPHRRIGLLVIDSKMDDTVPKIQYWASQAGRNEDVQILSPRSSYYYDFLAEVDSLDQVDEVVEKIISAAPWEESENAYWQHGRKPLLDAAFSVLLGTTSKLEFSEAMRFLRGWLMNPSHASTDVARRLEQFREAVAKVRSQATEAERNKLDCALDTIGMWKDLDAKTKSNWTSVFTNCLNPFTGLGAQGYFSPAGRQRASLEQAVTEGKIVVLSINAARDPALAHFLGRLIKADFYRAAQNRVIGYTDPGRLVGLVMDEYPLVVTGSEGRFGDITQLQTLRSKRAFVVASTQGFISLDMVIGAKAREALLINFNNLFFFNSHEAQIDAFAQSHFGLTLRSLRASLGIEELGGTLVIDRSSFCTGDWTCAPGRLSRLERNQAFVSLARGRLFSEPVWLESEYYSLPISAPEVEPSGPNVVDAFRRLHHDSVLRQAQDKAERALNAASTIAGGEPEIAEQLTASSVTQSSGGGVERSVHDPSPCTILLRAHEFARICGNRGIVTRFLDGCPEAREVIGLPKVPPPASRAIQLTIPPKYWDALLKQRAFNSVEKHFQKLLRRFRARAGRKRPGAESN